MSRLGGLFRRFMPVSAGCLLPALLFADPAAAAGREGVFLTIYDAGFAIVQEARGVELDEGVTQVALDDLPGLIDPDTATVSCLSAPGKVDIMESSFSGGLPGLYGLLRDRFFGREVRVITREGKVHEGVLAAYTDEHVVLLAGEEMVVVNSEYVSEVSLPEGAGGLSPRPILLLSLASEVKGPQQLELDYITDGMGWHAVYSLIVGKKGLSLEGRVSLLNRSGADYRDASFRLVSGGVRREAPKVPAPAAGMEVRDGPSYDTGVHERAFSDYQLFEVDHTTSLMDGEVKLIELFTAPDIKAEKEYTYEGGSSARINYTFVNSLENGLSLPLPAGRLGVYRKDPSGSLLLLGEDRIERTARGEEVRVYIGDAFDIVGERKQAETKHLTKRSREETYEIDLRNHKDEKVDVTVVERLSGNREWKVVSSSHEWRKEDSRTIEFPLAVAANGEEALKYTILYRW